MKVWAVAWNTYRGLLHNRALLALSLFFLFIFWNLRTNSET